MPSCLRDDAQPLFRRLEGGVEGLIVGACRLDVARRHQARHKGLCEREAVDGAQLGWSHRARNRLLYLGAAKLGLGVQHEVHVLHARNCELQPWQLVEQRIVCRVNREERLRCGIRHREDEDERQQLIERRELRAAQRGERAIERRPLQAIQTRPMAHAPPRSRGGRLQVGGELEQVSAGLLAVGRADECADRAPRRVARSTRDEAMLCRLLAKVLWCVRGKKGGVRGRANHRKGGDLAHVPERRELSKDLPILRPRLCGEGRLAGVAD
mmetsp:Transcript_38928/g.102612  ORF Transcript_38928/g.102612 Transcript_38928/m.102612 type:complete len:269 (-) Transcript_38928:81-887(-)